MNGYNKWARRVLIKLVLRVRIIIVLLSIQIGFAVMQVLLILALQCPFHDTMATRHLP